MNINLADIIIPYKCKWPCQQYAINRSGKCDHRKDNTVRYYFRCYCKNKAATVVISHDEFKYSRLSREAMEEIIHERALKTLCDKCEGSESFV